MTESAAYPARLKNLIIPLECMRACLRLSSADLTGCGNQGGSTLPHSKARMKEITMICFK